MKKVISNLEDKALGSQKENRKFDSFQAVEESFGEFKTEILNKLNDSVTWVRENPIQSVGIGVVLIMSVKSRVFRKALFWAATSFLSTEIFTPAANKDHQEGGNEIMDLEPRSSH